MLRFFCCTLLLLCTTASCFGSLRVFYADTRLSNQSYRDHSLLESIAQHHAAIDVVAPQVYTFNENGTNCGGPADELITLQKKYGFKLMPLVMNSEFDQQKLHQLLHDTTAQQRLTAQLLILMEKYHYWALQLDVENIPVSDRDAYTQFVQQTAAAFHQHHYKLSVTVLPNQIPPLLTNSYDAWQYDNWSGGYDIQALAKACDFITLMSYDKHNSLTTPGPVAPLPWVNLTIQHALTVTTGDKLLLGIPLYSGYWTTTARKNSFSGREHQISYKQAQTLLQQYQTTAKWSPNSATASATLHHPGELYSYLYMQNARSLAAAKQLIKDHHLLGFAAWQLGLEDPAIWLDSSGAKNDNPSN